MKICPSCQKQLEDDSFFCEYCGNQLESYSAISAISTQNSSSKKKSGKGAIITLSILLVLVICGAGFLGYMLYSTDIYYSEQLSIVEGEKANLQSKYDSVVSERDSYKKKYDTAQKNYNDAVATANKLRSDITTFSTIQDKLKTINPTNTYGGFGSRIYAVKKGEKITISFPYSYNKEITGWYDNGYDMNWLDGSYGTRKFTVKGKTPGVYIFRVTHDGKSATGGITTIIYVYE